MEHAWQPHSYCKKFVSVCAMLSWTSKLMVATLGACVPAEASLRGSNTSAFVGLTGMNKDLRSLATQQCADFSQWPNVDGHVTCGGCTALVLAGSPYNGRCDKYCASFGHVCKAAAEEVNENCQVKYSVRCNEAIQGTSDILCTCESRNPSPVPMPAPTPVPTPVPQHGGQACLCIFDIDRTLTGKQGSAGAACPRNRAVPGVWDSAYGGGTLTLSALASEGISSTFCGSCYLGVISAGFASGHNSAQRRHFEQHVLRTVPHDKLVQRNPNIMTWSTAARINSPFVLGQHDFTKQNAVPRILDIYRNNGIQINRNRVHFFGDRGGNIGFFRSANVNAREVSCKSRDFRINNAVGYCGALPEEIVQTPGVAECPRQQHR